MYQRILQHQPKTIMIISIVVACLCFNTNIQASEVEKNINFKRCWDGTSTVLAHMFGTTNVNVMQDGKVKSLKDFESFIAKQAISSNVALTQKILTVDDLLSLPKPLILLDKDKSGFTILLDIYKIGSSRLYHVLHGGYSPKIVDTQVLQKGWSGNAWFVDNMSSGGIIHDAGKLKLQISKSFHNFGLVETPKQETSIKIKNISEVPIKLKKTKSSCSCTTTMLAYDTILQPLQEMDLDCVVSLKKGQHGFRYWIIIPLEDMTRKDRSLLKVEVMGNFYAKEKFTGNSTKAVTLETSSKRLFFKNVKLNETPKQTFVITVPGESELDDVKVMCSSQALTSSALEKEPFQDINKYLVELTLNSSLLEKGKRYDEVVSFKIDNSEHKQVEIPVQIEVLPTIKLLPSAIVWGMVDVGEKRTKSIKFTSPYGGKLEISKCILPEGFESKIEKIGDYIRLNVTGEFNKPTKYLKEIKVLFSSPEEKEISIPMFANVRKNIKKAVSKTKTKRPLDTNIYDVNVGSSPVLGPDDAPVTIVIFSDFQCPYCVREFPKIKKMLENYPNKLKVVFKHFPLNFHKKAKPAHAAAEFAFREEGSKSFWSMHDKILENPKKLDISSLRGYAASLKLDMVKFDEMIASQDTIVQLSSTDKAEAKKCGVFSTPTVLINGLKMESRNIGDYRARIDQILTKEGGTHY